MGFPWFSLLLIKMLEKLKRVITFLTLTRKFVMQEMHRKKRISDMYFMPFIDLLFNNLLFYWLTDSRTLSTHPFTHSLTDYSNNQLIVP